MLKKACNRTGSSKIIPGKVKVGRQESAVDFGVCSISKKMHEYKTWDRHGITIYQYHH